MRMCCCLYAEEREGGGGGVRNGNGEFFYGKSE